MNRASNIRPVDPIHPQPHLIAEASQIIREGGVVVFPTRGLYGLGADATRPETVNRIFKIKRRAAHKPVSILIAERDQVADWITAVPPVAARLMDTFWPGRITLVLKSRPLVPANLTAGGDCLGIRRPGHPVADALVRASGRPITATSANLSGTAGCHRITDIPDGLLSAVDLVLDAGPLAGGAGSTVIDVSSGKVVILREGAVSAAEIEHRLGIKL